MDLIIRLLHRSLSNNLCTYMTSQNFWMSTCKSTYGKDCKNNRHVHVYDYMDVREIEVWNTCYNHAHGFALMHSVWFWFGSINNFTCMYMIDILQGCFTGIGAIMAKNIITRLDMMIIRLHQFYWLKIYCHLRIMYSKELG